MYDVKTHDAEAVRANLTLERQLNVYAHIWQNLRGQGLDEPAVISTALPEGLRRLPWCGMSGASVKMARGSRWPIRLERGHVAERCAIRGGGGCDRGWLFHARRT